MEKNLFRRGDVKLAALVVEAFGHFGHAGIR
jgi:hypothetical protein